jgi:hypothetical protein
MNALATIFFSLIAILASLLFVLFTLCSSSSRMGAEDRHFFLLCAMCALLVAIASMCKVAILNRKPRRIRESDPSLPPYSIEPHGSPPTAAEPATMQSSSIPSRDVSRVSRPRVPPDVPPQPIQPRVSREVVTYLPPASQAAVQQLALAIAAKIAAEVALGLVGWYAAVGSPRAPFVLFKFGFLAWGLAAIAPDLGLLYSLAHRPGPSSFAYSLVIPALHLLFGLSGHSALLLLIPRSGQAAIPLLSVIPWILDILVPYLAWKAIRFTGIRPDPARLITASVVILIYRTLLPVLFVLLN